MCCAVFTVSAKQRPGLQQSALERKTLASSHEKNHRDIDRAEPARNPRYCSFAYSDLASFRIGMSGSASQRRHGFPHGLDSWRRTTSES